MKYPMYQSVANYYDLVFPFKEAEANFLNAFLSGKQSALDLGTGTGSTAIYLSSKNLEVSALDLSSEMISLAKKKNNDVDFYVDDILSFLEKANTKYDLITCFGNTLAHLSSHDLAAFFKLVKTRLATNGKLLVQLLNYDRILRIKPRNLPLIENAGIRFIREYTYKKHTIIFKTSIYENENLRTEGEVQLYPHTKEMFQSLVAENGFSLETYGSFKMEPWTDDSSHLTLVIYIR